MLCNIQSAIRIIATCSVLPGNPAWSLCRHANLCIHFTQCATKSTEYRNRFSGQMTHALKPDARERFLRMLFN